MESTGKPGRRRGPTPLLAAVWLLGACASTEPAWNPGELDKQRQQQCKAVERAYREELPEYPALRDELAKDPVAISWFVRMLIRDLFTIREGRPLGSDEDLLRAAAKIEHIVEIRALAEFDAIGVAAVPTIVGDLLRHSQPQPRELGVELIGRIGAPALPAVRELAQDGEARHRRAAARAAAAIGITPDVLALLRKLAGDAEFTVRADALRGLRRGGGIEAQALLCARLRDDDDPFVRRQAARSLVGHPSQASAQALVDYLARCKAERDAQGEQTVQDALMALAGAKGPRTEEAWRKWASGWQPAAAERGGPK